MARNAAPYLQRGVIAAWKAYVPLTDLVPAARIYPLQRPPNPVWPFAAFGVPLTAPFYLSCVDGSSVAFAGHAYAETSGEGAQTIAGEERAQEIAAQLVNALDLTIDLQNHGAPWPAIAHVTWTGTQVIRDDTDAAKFHGIVNFEATVVS